MPPLRIAAAGLRCHDQSSSPNKAAAGEAAAASAPGIIAPFAVFFGLLLSLFVMNCAKQTFHQ